MKTGYMRVCVAVWHSVFDGSGLFIPQMSQKWMVEDKKLLKVTESVDYDVEGGFCASVVSEISDFLTPCKLHRVTS